MNLDNTIFVLVIGHHLLHMASLSISSDPAVLVTSLAAWQALCGIKQSKFQLLLVVVRSETRQMQHETKTSYSSSLSLP
ncbi:hypothetical protein HZ326_3037 [Fusarium oxysporum f. sp. albedinis]|nr:hypothetical protein HZ326_3037 [Fusarium oxysporum f. sp. albedinis]